MRDLMEIRLAQNFAWASWDLYGRVPRPDGKVAVVTSLTLTTVDQYAHVEPFARIESPQQVMDDLWAAGVRPSERLNPHEGQQAHIQFAERVADRALRSALQEK